MRFRTPLHALALLLLAAPALAAELRGHGGPVRAIAVTADGEAAITGSFDTSAILWSLRTGTARQVLRFHSGQVIAVAALPDGRFASAGEDARIALWEEGQEAPARVLAGHSAPVVALAVSPDGKTLASASWDTTVRLWPLSGGEPNVGTGPGAGGEPRVLTGHRGSVNALTYLADGTLVSGGYDARLMFWPPAGPPAAVSLPSPLNMLVALPGGRLAAGSADGRVRILDRAGNILDEAEVAPTPVISLAASADGRKIAAAGLKGAIALLDAELKVLHNLVGPGLPVWSLAFTPDGKTLLTGGSDRVVRRWDVETGEHVGAIASGGMEDPLAEHAGDPGAEVFRACVACHSLTPEGENRAGPTLYGLFGRKIASVAGYDYSDAFHRLDIVWTPETVSKLFEIGPAAYTPGTRMPEQRIGKAEDREALIRFLEKATKAE